MTTEQEKGLHEVSILKAFANLGKFNIDICSIEKCMPPKPDLFCRFDGLPVYFELARNYPKEFDQQLLEANEDVKRLWKDDSIKRIVAAKLTKKYQVEHPIQLLIYDDIGIALPNDVTTAKMKSVLAQTSHIQFEKIWYFANGKVVEVFSR